MCNEGGYFGECGNISGPQVAPPGHRTQDTPQGDFLSWRQREDTGHWTVDREVSSPGDKGRTQDTGHWTVDREVSSPRDKGRTQSSVKCGHRKYVGAELIRGGL